MSTREMPQDVTDMLESARQAERKALRYAVADLVSQGWTRAEAIAALKADNWGPTSIAAALGISKQRVWQMANPEKERARKPPPGLARVTTTPTAE